MAVTVDQVVVVDRIHQVVLEIRQVLVVAQDTEMMAVMAILLRQVVVAAQLPQEPQVLIQQVAQVGLEDYFQPLLLMGLIPDTLPEAVAEAKLVQEE